jgi:hypothetical protein
VQFNGFEDADFCAAKSFCNASGAFHSVGGEGSARLG